MRGVFIALSALLALSEAATLFQWKSSQPVISATGRNNRAVKDPTAVYYNGAYHVFMSSIITGATYNMIYTNFTDWSKAASAKQYYFNDNAVGGGYRAAPQVFYFAPQKLWYLVFQDGSAAYSTNTDISNFNGWSKVKRFYNSQPSTVTKNIGKGSWLDMWIICDSSNCYMFSSDDNGHLYRSKTSLSNFPNGFDEPVIALSDATPRNLFEASNMYKIGSKYLLLVEAGNPSWTRYFRAWTSPSPAGPYTPLADTFENPFAGSANVQFSGTAWTKSISHGDVVRRNVDQTMEIKECQLEYIYQGVNPNTPSSTGYDDMPWKVGVLTQTNSVCSILNVNTGTTSTPTTKPSTTTTKPVTTTKPATTTNPAATTKPSSGAALYAQCGGNGYLGPTTCAQGTCKKINDWYSQCV